MINRIRFLEHFDRLIDTADAVPHLRRFILDLAVRGKLVEQDPKDEPAGKLLKRIDVDAVWPDMPKNWLSASTGELLNLQYGKALPAIDRSDQGPVPVFGSNGVVGHSQAALTDKPAIIVGRKGSAGALNLCDGPSWTTDVAYFLIPPVCLDIRFLFMALQTLDLARLGKGVKPGLSRSEFYQLPVVVPPLAEQHRIVAKVDELMALCDELEAAQTKREKRRDRLVAATLHGLNNGDATPPPGNPSTFEESARFYFNHLPRLTTRPEHIHQLRQTILNLAVRGKLVPQDSKDQPASLLIEEIRKEKRTLIGQGSIKSGKPLQKIGDSVLLFDLPKGWSWVRLGELAKMVTSGSRDWAQHYSDKGAVFVRMGNLSRGSYHLRLNHLQRVKPPADTEGARTRLEEDDILISITGEVGLLGLIPANFGEAYINQHTCLVRPMAQLRNRYLPELFRSPFAQDQFNEPQRGIKNSFRLTDVTEFIVPLPPIAEQRRIVAKLDELMALCDEMEDSLSSMADSARNCLESMLDETLMGFTAGAV